MLLRMEPVCPFCWYDRNGNTNQRLALDRGMSQGIKWLKRRLERKKLSYDAM